MAPISILNDVLGPVMHGPSSSHTAGSYHIGRLARGLLGDEPAEATFVFDPGGSYAQVYRQQGSDLGFVAGLLGWDIADERFPRALESAAAQGLAAIFAVEPLSEADHPNSVEIRLVSQAGRRLRVVAKSIGGGAVVLTRLNEWPVHLTGDAYEVLVEVEGVVADEVGRILAAAGAALGALEHQGQGDRVLLRMRRQVPLPAANQAELARLSGVRRIWTAGPVFFVLCGEPLFANAAAMVSLAAEGHASLGEVALAYEAQLLGLPQQEVLAEVVRRDAVMRAAVQRGLAGSLPPMQLLRPTADAIFRAEAEGRVAVGGIHTRAAARAMAVMHVNGAMGVVCAAPTAGSAGVLPGVVVTLAEEWGLQEADAALALLAAAAVGVIVATRATFAAEIAGCQVEIGAAGAMAAAAVVEVAGGTARQAVDAAAISLQNTMGSICDLVQGIVEIPCHTRNAVAAASAFVCADLVLGGYANPVPLDETVDAVLAVGQMLPRELRCTALGGLSLAPAAKRMPRLR